MSDVGDYKSGVLGKGKGKDFLSNPHSKNRPQQQNHVSQHGVKDPSIDIPYLPPNFGRRLKLDVTDNKLLKFCKYFFPPARNYINISTDLVAYCDGRTLLPKTNFWMSNIGPMAVEEECVKHALLALAGAYVLDYSPSLPLLERTNNHYLRAAALISEALSSTATRQIDKADSVVSALSLLIVDDVSARHPSACQFIR
jgi:hypothetical protein